MSQEIFSKSTIHTKRNLLIADFASILFSWNVITLNEASFLGGKIHNLQLFSITLFFLISYLAFSTYTHVSFDNANREKLKANNNFEEATDEIILFLQKSIIKKFSRYAESIERDFKNFKSIIQESDILSTDVIKISQLYILLPGILKVRASSKNELSNDELALDSINLSEDDYINKHIFPLFEFANFRYKETEKILKTAKTANKNYFNFETYIPVILTGLALGSLIIKSGIIY